jgi:formylglycine-generating enzyme required for sulfatase activity
MHEPILKLSNSQARELAGRLWTIYGRTYRFVELDPATPGQPPWKTGAEGRAFPLTDDAGRIAIYAKFFKTKSQKRFDRTIWLTSQRIHSQGRALEAAPMLWADSRSMGRPSGVDFDITACCAQAVPGETWKELKYRIHNQSVAFPDSIRWRCIEDFLTAAAALEQVRIIHGDFSDNNVIIDLHASANLPALYLIDFDAFAAVGAPHLTLSVQEGGTYGMEGYCPPDLGQRVNAGDRSAAPYSDRYGRDMLLFELLLYSRRFSPDDPPATWPRDAYLHKLCDAAKARCPRADLLAAIGHLQLSSVFDLPEVDRPSSLGLMGRTGSHIAPPVAPSARPAPRSVGPPRPQAAVPTAKPAHAPVRRSPGPVAAPTPTTPPNPPRWPFWLAAAVVVLAVYLGWRWFSSPVRPAGQGAKQTPVAQYASLDGLASGSQRAQARQAQTVEQAGLPLEVTARKTGIVFRLIPAGSFTMGSPSSESQRSSDETGHPVMLTKPFYCGKFEVTQGQWEQVMGSKPSNFKNVGNDAPVESVSWDDCQAFVKRLCQIEGVPEGTYRLLTEAEWEYACRAGTQTAFCYGNDLDSSRANFDGDYPYGSGRKGTDRRTTVAVGSFRPNAWGLYDMHGNVWEWCQDWYEDYSSGSVTDPLGPASGDDRVRRGGSWFIHGGGWICRSAFRSRSLPGGRGNDLGLRLARTTPSGQPSDTSPVVAEPKPTGDAVQTPGLVAGKDWVVPDLGMEMVYVEPGSFQMGSDSGDSDEKPVHTVRISRAFWMGKYEVTQSQYQALTGTNPSSFKGLSLPVESVSWNDAVAFCRTLTDRERKAGRLPQGYAYRLPTEAEWEYAARGGSKSRGFEYAGSGSFDEVAWHSGNSGSKTHPAGQKKPNELGLYDMSGNVWEWCHDSHDAGYYAKSPASDPTGVLSGGLRVLRGGSWYFLPWFCRSSYRHLISPVSSANSRGFRVVASWPLD